MKKPLAIYILFLLSALCVFWCVFAPYLSAHNVISVLFEVGSYSIALIIVVACCVLSVIYLRSGRLRAVAILWFVCAVFFVMASYFSLGNSEFGYWKLKWIQKRDWNQMSGELAIFGSKTLQSGETYLPTQSVPLGFRMLGLANDNPHGWAQVGETGTNYSNILVCLLYGSGRRTWGLYIGPERFAQFRWPKFNRIQVGTNAYFVIGDNS